jgi:hypothetical protein
VSVIEALLELQDVDGRIVTLEKELKDLPVRRAQEVARLNGSSADLKASIAAQEQFINRVKSYDEEAKALKLKIDDCIYDFDGYMDSGNTLIKYDKPVIFLGEKYLRKDNLKEMIVNGVGKKMCKYTEGNITINGSNKSVICAFVDNVSFKGCQCLLNINLLEEKK